MTKYIKSKKINKLNHDNKGMAVLSLIIICFIVCLGIFYLIQTNGLVGYSYEIRELENNIRELEIENQELETKSAQYQSPANLDKLIQPLNLIDTRNVIYLEKQKAVATIE